MKELNKQVMALLSKAEEEYHKTTSEYEKVFFEGQMVAFSKMLEVIRLSKKGKKK